MIFYPFKFQIPQNLHIYEDEFNNTIFLFAEDALELVIGEVLNLSVKTQKKVISIDFVEDDPFLKEGLEKHFEKVPETHAYGVIYFKDEENHPVAKIVGSDIVIRSKKTKPLLSDIFREHNIMSKTQGKIISIS